MSQTTTRTTAGGAAPRLQSIIDLARAQSAATERLVREYDAAMTDALEQVAQSQEQVSGMTELVEQQVSAIDRLRTALADAQEAIARETARADAADAAVARHQQRAETLRARLDGVLSILGGISTDAEIAAIAGGPQVDRSERVSDGIRAALDYRPAAEALRAASAAEADEQDAATGPEPVIVLQRNGGLERYDSAAVRALVAERV